MDGYGPEKRHNNGFDNRGEGNCEQLVNPNNEDFELMCCGDYPNRFPYKHSESRGCCHGKTYNMWNFQCCDNGGLKAFGNVC